MTGVDGDGLTRSWSMAQDKRISNFVLDTSTPEGEMGHAQCLDLLASHLTRSGSNGDNSLVKILNLLSI